MLLHPMGMSALDDGWCLDAEPAPKSRDAQPAIADENQRRLSKLLREAMLILDGEAPDEVPLHGDGWSLIGPVEPKAKAEPEPEPAPAPSETASLDAAPRDNVVAFPVPETTEPDPLRMAIHDALEEALTDGWNLVDDEEPAATLELSAEEQAFFDAGDELSTQPVVDATQFEPELDQRAGFWTRFWRKTA